MSVKKDTSLDATVLSTEKRLATTALPHPDTQARWEREDRCKTLFETMAQGVIFQDASGVILSANPAAERILGLTVDQMQGRLSGNPRWRVVHEDGSDFPVAEHPGMMALRVGREVRSVVMGILNPEDGRYRWTNVNAVPLFRPGESAPFEVYTTFEDITERRLALREEHQRLAGIIKGTNTGTWDWYVQTGETVFNARWAEIIGYTLEEISPVSIDTWTKFAHPDDLKASDALIKKHFRGELHYYEFESRMKHKDGSWVGVLDRGKVTKWTEDGKPLLMQGTRQDITERMRAEETLWESEDHYRTLFEYVPDGILIADPENHCSDANASMCRMLGYTRNELIGLHASDIVAPTEILRVGPALNVITARSDSSREWQFRRKDGSVFAAEVSATMIFDGNLLAVIRDITERKRAEDEKAKLEAQLQQAQKMESVGRLAGGVAHDFNNMLSIILGNAEMALQQVDPTQPLYADLMEIQETARRSADLTRQLLAFARKQTIAPEVLDLNEVVAGMLKMLRRLIGEDIDLAWLPEAGVWPVRMDPSQIDQILANLCVNARDAIADVGTVTIKTGNVTLDEAYCAEHRGFIPGEYVLLAMSDDGSGMDKDILAHIFEPFFTTKDVHKGTGLGLATVYGIVKQNKGFINVYSETGHGTTFTIYLPRHADDAGQARSETPAEPAPRGQETILLVEDEPTILKLTRRMLEGQGYIVLAASTPGDAIRMAKEHAGELHLLMTDVIMPEMNGRALAMNVLSLYPRLKRLFMSGYTADVIARHGVLDGGVSFLQKPFSTEDLATKVREALDRE